MSKGLKDQGRGQDGCDIDVMFQPILDLDKNRVFGFESRAGLSGISGIQGFATFETLLSGTQLRVWQEDYHRESLRAFREQSSAKYLVLPVSQASAKDCVALIERLLESCAQHSVEPHRVVLQLTAASTPERQPAMLEMLGALRATPFLTSLTCDRSSIPGLASAALLAGVNCLKLNRSVVRGLDNEPLVQDAVAAMLELASPLGVRVMAGSVSNYLEFDTLRRLGVALVQGGFIADAQRLSVEEVDISELLPEKVVCKGRSHQVALRELQTHRRFLSPTQSLQEALELYQHHSGHTPVVLNNKAVGILSESSLLGAVLDHGPRLEHVTVADCLKPSHDALSADTTVAELGASMKQGRKGNGQEGFVLTEANGDYAGFLSAADAMQGMASYQHEQVRHANPLTGLPGRVVLDEQVHQLLREQSLFVVVLISINDLGAYNDAYGYSEGDRVIQQVASVLVYESDSADDYVSHISGGQFSIVFKSVDWFERCDRMVTVVDRIARGFYGAEDQLRGSVCNVDRLGRRRFAPFFSLSIGAVPVFPGKFSAYKDVFASAAEVQQRASETYGGAIYVDQRKYRSATGHLTVRLS